jgi:hypothetical protein
MPTETDDRRKILLEILQCPKVRDIYDPDYYELLDVPFDCKDNKLIESNYSRKYGELINIKQGSALGQRRWNYIQFLIKELPQAKMALVDPSKRAVYDNNMKETVWKLKVGDEALKLACANNDVLTKNNEKYLATFGTELHLSKAEVAAVIDDLVKQGKLVREGSKPTAPPPPQVSLCVSSSRWTAPPGGGDSMTVKITGNGGSIKYVVSSDEMGWLTPSDSKGTTPGELTLKAAPNRTQFSRTGKVTIVATSPAGVGDSPQVITVTQAKKVGTFGWDPARVKKVVVPACVTAAVAGGVFLIARFKPFNLAPVKKDTVYQATLRTVPGPVYIEVLADMNGTYSATDLSTQKRLSFTKKDILSASQVKDQGAVIPDIAPNEQIWVETKSGERITGTVMQNDGGKLVLRSSGRPVVFIKPVIQNYGKM